MCIRDRDMKALNLQNRTAAIIENGTWAPQAGKIIREHLNGMKGMTVLEPSLTIRSSMKESQADDMKALAQAIAESIAEKQ